MNVARRVELSIRDSIALRGPNEIGQIFLWSCYARGSLHRKCVLW
jgi:hypothetical protein